MRQLEKQSGRETAPKQGKLFEIDAVLVRFFWSAVAPPTALELKNGRASYRLAVDIKKPLSAGKRVSPGG